MCTKSHVIIDSNSWTDRCHAAPLVGLWCTLVDRRQAHVLMSGSAGGFENQAFGYCLTNPSHYRMLILTGLQCIDKLTNSFFQILLAFEKVMECKNGMASAITVARWCRSCAGGTWDSSTFMSHIKSLILLKKLVFISNFNVFIININVCYLFFYSSLIALILHS